MASKSSTSAAASSTLPPHKAALLDACLEARSLTFGTFTLKSGRVSPFFFNAGTLHTGRLLSIVAAAYAATIAQHNPSLEFDVVFGPAYKGIPLCCTAVEKLYALDPARYGRVSYCFNRKSAKTYGDLSTVVGADMKGKRVLVLDDVITAGTAIRDAFDIIKAQGGEVVGVVVALDRQEKAPPSPEEVEAGEDDSRPRMSAIGEIRKNFGVPVLAVLTLDDIIEGYRAIGSKEDIERLEQYRERYRAAD